MPVLTYTAVDRGDLASGHVAGQQYQIETAFEQFPRDLIAKGEDEETLDGTPEGWLDAVQREWNIVTDLVFAANVDAWREFITSVINRETFSIDFTGTIASPGPDYDVSLVTRQVNEQQIGSAGFKYAFRVKQIP